MINLTKADEHATIDLTKGSSNTQLEVHAQWVDNGDGDDNNDDLDLRCSILMPSGDMYLVDGVYKCGLDEIPYARHHGDVTKATADAPGEEIITVAKDIAQRSGGPVALCFSVYSAVGNGAVSVASLQPRMQMRYGDQVVQCQFDFQKAGASDPDIYTYVIGYAIVTGEEVILAPSGKTSTKGSECTPWPYWTDNSDLELEVNGPAVFKGTAHNKAEKYNDRHKIQARFANVSAKGKKGFLGGLFG